MGFAFLHPRGSSNLCSWDIFIKKAIEPFIPLFNQSSSTLPKKIGVKRFFETLQLKLIQFILF